MPDLPTSPKAGLWPNDALADAEHAQNAWTTETSTDAWLANLPPSSSNLDHSTPATPSSSPDLCSLTTTNDDEEDFGPFQSASTNPFAQPIYTAHEDDEHDSLLDNPDSLQVSGIFSSMGLVPPVYARFDASTRETRRTGKSRLRRFIAKEKARLKEAGGIMTEEGIDEMREIEGRGKVDSVAGEKEDAKGEEGGGYGPRLNGVMRPVNSALTVQREIAEQMEGLVEEE